MIKRDFMKNSGYSKFAYNLIVRGIKILDIFLMTFLFSLSWFDYYDKTLSQSTMTTSVLVLALFVVLFVFFARVYDAFLISVGKALDIVYSQIISVLFSDGILYLLFCVIDLRLLNILPIFYAFLGQTIGSYIWYRFASWLYFKLFPAKKTIVIYDEYHNLDRLIKEYGLQKKFNVFKTIQSSKFAGEHLDQLNEAECVFLCGLPSHERNILLKYCIRNDIGVYLLPRLGDSIMSGSKSVHILHEPVLQVARYNPSPEFLIVKRVFDILVSGAAIVILSPIMLITALFIKGTDGGPVFYKQTRLTKDGKEFKVIKFRSMRVDAEKDGVARLSTGKNDSRVTKVGKVIRKCRIDELPQLFNILGGSMSIVGPRPERPEIAREYLEELPEFDLRLQAKAGLTGYAQVYGKYNTTPYDKLQMDLMYIANPSIIEDLRIMFATVKILFISDSTEGIESGQINAMGTNKNQ